ncbi:hypothetical protein HDU96_009576 [Phlyctochytrium bullatum]|nr:hypothetical protein HDU96_009576 [Phlyctochytrium bullatum]
MVNFELIAAVAGVALFSTSASASFIRTVEPPLPVIVGGSASSYAHCGYYLDFTSKQCEERFDPDAPTGKPTTGDCRSAAANYTYNCIRAIDKGEIPFPFIFQYPNTTSSETPSGVQNRAAATATATAAPSRPAANSDVILTASYVGLAKDDDECDTHATAATKTCEEVFKGNFLDSMPCTEEVGKLKKECSASSTKDEKTPFPFLFRFPPLFPPVPNLNTPYDFDTYVYFNDLADDESFCEPLGEVAKTKCRQYKRKIYPGATPADCLVKAGQYIKSCKTRAKAAKKPVQFLFTYPSVLVNGRTQSRQLDCTLWWTRSRGWCDYALKGKVLDNCRDRLDDLARNCSKNVAEKILFPWKFEPFRLPA